MSNDLAAAIAEQLTRNGETRTVYHSHTERDRIRHAGRHAGRLLTRPVRTVDIPATPYPRCNRDQCGMVAIMLTDWGTNPLEARLTSSRANNAIDRALAAPYQQ